jgi:hypothetical protein
MQKIRQIEKNQSQYKYLRLTVKQKYKNEEKEQDSTRFHQVSYNGV